jgi:hypothetical protein
MRPVTAFWIYEGVFTCNAHGEKGNIIDHIENLKRMSS